MTQTIKIREEIRKIISTKLIKMTNNDIDNKNQRGDSQNNFNKMNYMSLFVILIYFVQIILRISSLCMGSSLVIKSTCMQLINWF